MASGAFTQLTKKQTEVVTKFLEQKLGNSLDALVAEHGQDGALILVSLKQRLRSLLDKRESAAE